MKHAGPASLDQLAALLERGELVKTTIVASPSAHASSSSSRDEARFESREITIQLLAELHTIRALLMQVLDKLASDRPGKSRRRR